MPPMPRWAAVTGTLLGYVALSSLLSAGVYTLIVAGPRLFWRVWTGSGLASLVFVGASAAVGWGAFELGRRKQWWPSVALGIVGTWLVYVLSFWLLVSLPGSPFYEFYTGGGSGAGIQPLDLLGEIVVVGWAGILFAGLSPAALAWWTSEESGQLESEG